MFKAGFEKQAFVPGLPGYLAGVGARATKAVGKGLSWVKEQNVAGYRKGVGHVNKGAVGDTLANKRFQKYQAGERAAHGSLPNATEMEQKAKEIQRNTKQDVLNRLNKVQDQKPNWMMRHPLATAGAGVVAGKMMFGEKKEEQPAQFYYPQQ